MSDKKIIIYTPQEIEAMRDVCRRASELLDYITPFVKAGVSTLSLDELMLEYTEKVLEAKSACLNYCPPGMTPYPRATCISVNNVICHGIPSEKKILKNGQGRLLRRHVAHVHRRQAHDRRQAAGRSNLGLHVGRH